jgi:hypothetical protein
MRLVQASKHQAHATLEAISGGADWQFGTPENRAQGMGRLACQLEIFELKTELKA